VPPKKVWKGAKGLRSKLVDVATIELHPRNPRRGNVPEIARSLERWGQTKPVLTDGRYIVAGNHTYKAALSLGWTHIAAVAHQFSSPEQARRYLLTDNRTSDLGDYAKDELLAMLEELEETGEWEGTGYMVDDVEDLRAMQDAVKETERAEFGGGFAATEEELAERAARLAAGNTYKELICILADEQVTDFELHVKILRKEYEESGVSEAVARALHEQAALA
jgi:ParB-like chromosome segregation protein Spo0J